MKKLILMVSLLLPTLAFAQAAAATPGQPSMLEVVAPFGFMLLVLYFLVLRPQMRKQKEHQTFVTAVKRGDEIITQNGILGRIEGLTEQFVTLEIAEGVRVKMLRSQIAGSAQAVIQNAQKESTKK